jgi:hypothetical protein
VIPSSATTLQRVALDLREVDPRSEVSPKLLGEWCHEGLLDAELTWYRTKTGLREGWVIANSSRDDARTKLRKVGWDNSAATAELRALHAERIAESGGKSPPSRLREDLRAARADAVKQVEILIIRLKTAAAHRNTNGDGAAASNGATRAAVPKDAPWTAPNKPWPLENPNDSAVPGAPALTRLADRSVDAEPMRSAAHVAEPPVEPKQFDQRSPTNDEETRTAIKEVGEKTHQILGQIRDCLVPATPQMAKRPTLPTRAYCLKSPNRIQWIGEIDIEQRLWHLLGAILDSRCQPLSFGMAGEAMSPGSMLACKTIANCVAELNKALIGVEWPHTYRTKNRSILTDINFPPATA